jgi:hypothetical protein
MLLTMYVDDLLLMGPPAACEDLRRRLQETSSWSNRVR